MNKSTWTILDVIGAIGAIVVLGLFAIAGVGLYFTVTEDNKRDAQMPFLNASNTVYSLQHPDVVGTNDQGEVVKHYHDYTLNCEIYEIGDTRTTTTWHGKFKPSITVTHENHP